MASIWKRTQNGKQSWVARWYEPDGRQRAKTFRRKVDAENWLVSVEHAKRTETYVGRSSGGEVLMREWAQTWTDSKLNLKASTKHRYSVITRTHIVPAFGSKQLKQIRHSDVTKWMADLSTRLRPSSVRQAYVILSQMLDMAVLDQRIVTNPAKGVERPRLRKDPPNPFTWAQLVRLSELAGDYHGLIFLTLGTTGLRFGELAGLQVSDVDATRARLHVRRNLVDVSGTLVEEDPKNHELRTVPMAAVVAKRIGDLTTERSGAAWLFTSPRGLPLRLNNWRRRVFDPTVKKLGLEGKTPHDLRDTAATLAIKAGASVKDVQQMLGHASAVMTLDRYAGWFEDGLDELASRLDRSHMHWTGTDPERGGAAVSGLDS